MAAAKAPVILEMDVHCYGCKKKIQKAIKKMQGVKRVSASVDTRQVVVEGEADAAALKAWLEYKLKRAVTIIGDGADPPPPPETETNNDPPQPNIQPPPLPGPPQGDPPSSLQYSGGNPSQTYGSHYPYGGWNPSPTYGSHYPYRGGNPSPTYGSQYVPNDAPATFSDENPNACSIQ